MRYAKRSRHGMTDSPTHESWSAMWNRCTNENAGSYALGTPIHPAWSDFLVFLEDVGARPNNTTLDRIDRTRGYEPGNVRWASKATQSRNRSCAKLVEDDVIAIRDLIGRGTKQRDIASAYGISESMVTMIKQGRKWS